jgi:hypothetical protein
MRGAAALLVVCWIGVARADEQADLYVQGQQFFEAGAYLDAAAKFEAAYELGHDPAFLYNIAQAYRLARVCAKAADYYQRFFAAVPNPPEAEKIRGFADESAACAREQAPKPLPPPPQPPPAPRPSPVITPQAPSTDRGASKRIAGIAAASSGAALVAVGGYFTWSASDLAAQRTSLCQSCTWTPERDATARDLDRRGHRAASLAIASYTIGGAALAAGVVLYLLGRSEAPAVEVEPIAGGVSISSRFSF